MNRIIHILSAGLALGLVTLGCELPTEVEVKGSPGVELPVGRMTVDLKEALPMDELQGDMLDEDTTIEIHQDDILTDFGLPSADATAAELPADRKVSFAPGGDLGEPIEIGPSNDFTEVAFATGTLNVPLNFTDLSDDVEIEITDFRIVDPNNDYAEIATAAEAARTVGGANTGLGTSAPFSFDLSGVVLPDTFALEISLEFTNPSSPNPDPHEFSIAFNPEIVDYELSRITGVAFGPESFQYEYDEIYFDLPDFMDADSGDSIVIDTGELLMEIDIPADWSGVIVALSAELQDDTGAHLASDEDSGQNPQIQLDLAGVSSGGQMQVVLSVTVTGEDATIPFTNGIASVDQNVQLIISSLAITLGERRQITDGEGNPIYSAESDLFGRTEVDDETISDFIDNIEYAAMNFLITNNTGLNPELIITDEPFEVIFDFGLEEDTIELTQDDFDHFKSQFFLPEVQLWLPEGTIQFNTDEELSFGLWLDIRSNINRTFPVGGEE